MTHLLDPRPPSFKAQAASRATPPPHPSPPSQPESTNNYSIPTPTPANDILESNRLGSATSLPPPEQPSASQAEFGDPPGAPRIQNRRLVQHNVDEPLLFALPSQPPLPTPVTAPATPTAVTPNATLVMGAAAHATLMQYDHTSPISLPSPLFYLYGLIQLSVAASSSHLSEIGCHF